MNAGRRKELEKLLNQLGEIKEGIQSCFDEEEEYRDNMPESFQNSDRYTTADEACDNLSSALDRIADAESSIESAIGG